MESLLISSIIFAFFIYGARSATFTFENNCKYTVWPAALTGSGSQLSSTGFELASKATTTLNIPAPWSGRIWGRTNCVDQSGKFTCATGDCASGQVNCSGASGVPPVSLIELTLAPNGGRDFYDISLVDGFNLPISLNPQGGSGDCKGTACKANINLVCPGALEVTGPGGGVVACKSACLAFQKPEYCCTGGYASPNTCESSNYSRLFKSQCPQAYSYAYDDKSSLSTCSGGADYVVTFCP